MIRIVLVDDHVVLRQGMRALLEMESDLEVVGEASNGQEAVELALDYRPDLVLMDLLMPELDGIAATQVIRSERPDVQVIILSSIEEEAAVVGAVRAGAIGYVQKSAPIEVLLATIRGAAEGRVQFSPAAAARLVQEVRSPDMQPEHLTRREVEVLEFVARGLANKEIAWKLSISEKTVKSHVSTILGKFGFESRTQAALYAASTGLVSVQPFEPGSCQSMADHQSSRSTAGRALDRRLLEHPPQARAPRTVGSVKPFLLPLHSSDAGTHAIRMANSG